MSENDATRDDAEHRSLGAALTDLAATMPDDSYPVDDIHAKARHLRKRQRAARATVSVVAGAAVIAALVAVLPDRTPVSTTPASQVPIAEPSCADALAAAPPPPTPEEVQAAQAAKQAAAGDAPTNLRGIKARGTIVSTTDTSVTFTPDPQMPRGDQLGEITATVGPATEFYDGDTKVVTRPPLAAGDEAMFVASSADDGSYQLMVLAVHVPENVGSPTDTVDPAVKSASAAASDDHVKGAAEVVSVQPGSLTIRFTDGQQADQVVTAALGPGTVYRSGEQECIDPALTAGQNIGVGLERDATGAYTVDIVAFETPPSPQPAGP